MTTRVLLVRHGATTQASEDRFAGRSDVPLSPEGERQARRLAERLAGRGLDAVYSSPLQRALRTAEILAAPHSLPVGLEPDLREVDHGRWEGLKRSEVEALYPQEYRAWEQDPFTFAPEGGESGLAVLARALPALRRLVSSHPGQTLLVVSHKATIRLLLGSFLGFDLRGYRDHLDQSPCSLNVLDFKDPGRARLMLFNDISHYEDTPGPRQASLSKWWDAAL
ncbi:MAG TPA: histidine phosphatase family protein [Candidatus Nitrosotenuis sp.]|jgi:probable phosphoglycerate mutase|nr:histidine phosphatase family protein [Candidatus Nitrosotenuis sp.]